MMAYPAKFGVGCFGAIENILPVNICAGTVGLLIQCQPSVYAPNMLL
jgi:hypothetical protein